MNTAQINMTVTPSTDVVPLLFKQTFKEGGVSKNIIKFDREEDMILMCLSTFVHDYVHDYNLGTMHTRVIKGNIIRTEPDKPSLFETLGINIGNTIFKIMAYPVGGPRDINVYNDEQFEDKELIETDNNYVDKNNFYDYLNNNEESVNELSGGTKIQMEAIRQEPFETKSDIRQKPIIQDITNKEDIIQDITNKEDIIQDITNKEDITQDIISKTITFDNLKYILFIPSVISSLNIEQIVSTFEKNADFLNFHSSLNTYVVTYIGYDTNKYEELTTIEKNKNKVADEAIKASLKYIISDLKDSNNSMYNNFYGDMFNVLMDSYEIITKKKSDSNFSPFDILNSPEMLYQFIILYICYITVENYDKFKEITLQSGGLGGEGDVEGEKINLLPQQQTETIEIPEYVYITHNNLLTTITRGMFIKLGIWKEFFFPDKPIQDVIPEDYVFGFKELNQISYDKLVEIYPINPEINGKRKGHKNNELLILQILILKRLLVEMSPSKTLTFGEKIDDDLKNFMDSFYLQNYDIKELPKQENNVMIDSEIYNNPKIESGNEVERNKLEEDAEKMFAMNYDDYENPEKYYGVGYGENMRGGMNYEDRMAMIQAKRDIEKNLNNIDTTAIPKIDNPIIKNPDVDIIEPGWPPGMPILFNKLKKMYQNNIYTIQQLKNSKIEPIMIGDTEVNNLYKLLSLNEILIHKTGSSFNIPAPKYKFVINNAANIGSNINGSRMFMSRKELDIINKTIKEINEDKLTTLELETELTEKYSQLENDYEIDINELNLKKNEKRITIREYNDLLMKQYKLTELNRPQIVPLKNKLFLLKMKKENPAFYEDFENNYVLWFRDSQPLFGLYRNLQRGTFCPTSSMMDAMDNCSLKYKSTEPKEVGTSFSEILYEETDENGNPKLDGKKISFGGVVLNYNQIIDDNEALVARIYYKLDCSTGATVLPNDIVTISTMEIKVSDSNDLKARVAYRGVINIIKQIYNSTETIEQLEGIDYIKEMWKKMQYQYDQRGFNLLLGATSIKTMGDYLQECQACFKWGGYVSNTDAFPEELKGLTSFMSIKNNLIYRSVSKGGTIIPYNRETGNALRFGIQGDRPSGFRSIYMLLNGENDVNEQTITGYMFTLSTQNPSRTLIVSRNSNIMREPNSNGLKGNVIYATRELQVSDRDGLLKSLEYLNIKDKKIKVEGEVIIPEIRDTTVPGSEELMEDTLLENPMPKMQPLKNDAYDLLIDYANTEFIPNQPAIEILAQKEIEKAEMAEKKERERIEMAEKKEREKAEMAEKKERERIEMLEQREKEKAEMLEKKAKEKAEMLEQREKEKAEMLEQREKEKVREKLDKLAKKERDKIEKEQRELKINEAKRKINNQRKDLTQKQKTTKAIQKIPLDVLTKIDPKELQIEQDIYDAIFFESQENKRISDLASQHLASKAELGKLIPNPVSKGGTLSNKREQICKKTKRQYKKGNKLTKRYVICKIHKKTRKILN